MPVQAHDMENAWNSPRDRDDGTTRVDDMQSWIGMIDMGEEAGEGSLFQAGDEYDDNNNEDDTSCREQAEHPLPVCRLHKTKHLLLLLQTVTREEMIFNHHTSHTW